MEGLDESVWVGYIKTERDGVERPMPRKKKPKDGKDFRYAEANRKNNPLDYEVRGQETTYYAYVRAVRRLEYLKNTFTG